MRMEKREFVREFSQFLCPGQTRTRVACELKSKTLYKRFFNSDRLKKCMHQQNVIELKLGES